MVLESLTAEQRVEIDAHILAGRILMAIRSIREACGVGLREAIDLNRARYRQLREERVAKFACDDETYWSGYSECVGDAIAHDL